MSNSSKQLQLTESQVQFLLSPAAIRDRAEKIFARAQSGDGYFVFHEDKFAGTVDFVLATIQKNYPRGDIPFHSRWGHFRAGGIDRVAGLQRELSQHDPLERARVLIDLVIPSVLLDAGAGASWSFREASPSGTPSVYSRSEGLGIASLQMFRSGAMSEDGKSLRADGTGLSRVTAADLERHFQVTSDNPLVGVSGRVTLLNQLGRVVQSSRMFKTPRPGAILDFLIDQHGRSFSAEQVLRAVLVGFGSIWPGRLAAGSVNLGDVWLHSQLASADFDSLVPIHKLSQWLTYSLLEPIADAGIELSGVDGLTGLAEYRNGGLMLDAGLLSLKDPRDADKAWQPGSDLIIEWRSLTVALLDRIAVQVQKRLGKSAAEFPLAKVLEGGTWWAGRALAKEKRPGSGDPPLRIVSDGTVF